MSWLKHRIVSQLAVLALLIAMAGCAQNQEDTSSAPGTPSPNIATQGAGTQAGGGDAALIATGQKVFATHGCSNCHAIGGQGGQGGKGPDLSHVGAEAEHTPQWLVEHIKNPRAHNPRSQMPAFEGKINDQELLALGAYLASLK